MSNISLAKQSGQYIREMLAAFNYKSYHQASQQKQQKCKSIESIVFIKPQSADPQFSWGKTIRTEELSLI